MAPSEAIPVAASKGVERVRHELLTALHFGRLAPGDRVPSVRRLAELTGMNRKTVHRAYRILSGEGFLLLRPGSGTFVAEPLPGRAVHAPLGELLSAANRCRGTADRLGFRPDQIAGFLKILLGGGLRDLPLVVTECNHEQLGLIETDLRAHYGVQTRPVLLSDLAAHPRETVRRVWGVVTTDCHRAEVTRLLERLDVPVYRLALDPGFPRRLMEAAASGPVVMVVRDRRFVPVFHRLLRQLAAPDEIVGRFHIIEPASLPAVLGAVDGPGSIYVSPLVRGDIEGLPCRLRRLELRWRVDSASRDRLAAGLALDLAVRKGDAEQRRRAG